MNETVSIDGRDRGYNASRTQNSKNSRKRRLS